MASHLTTASASSLKRGTAAAAEAPVARPETGDATVLGPSVPDATIPAFGGKAGPDGSGGAGVGAVGTPGLASSSTSSGKKSNADIAVSLLLDIGAILVTSWVASILVGRLLKSINAASSGAGMSEEEAQASTAAEKRLTQLLGESDPGRPVPPLTSYERQIAQDVIDPRDITVHFSDIGGMDSMKQEIWELVVMPLRRPDLFCTSHLLTAPGGILLYGPPGTGKTMLAKAIAREAGATFLAVKLSKIMSKWFGESNKLIDAIFSLANKLAPSIIFIDEIDTFLNPRDGSENSAGNAIKAEFLTLWDGITTAGGGGGDGKDDDYRPVMVLGATNRPKHVDDAILRRLPRSFRIELPDEAGRLQILRLTLGGHPMSPDAETFLPTVAKLARGYSGSDLKEMCHCAALQAVREVMREESRKAVMTRQQQQQQPPPTQEKQSKQARGKRGKAKAGTAKKPSPAGGGTGEEEAIPPSPPPSPVRPMSVDDLKVAMTKVKRTGQDAAEYERSRFEHDHPNARRGGDNNYSGSSNGAANDNNNGMMHFLSALSQLMQQSQHQQQQPQQQQPPNGGSDDGSPDDIPDLE